MKLILIDNPKQGQIACAKSNYEKGIYFFFTFSNADEYVAKKNEQQYYVIVKDNPVPSLEQIAKVLNDAIGGALDRGASDNDVISRYEEFKQWFDFKYVVNNIHNWKNLTAIPKQNGVETDKEQPGYEEDDYLG